jgi:hypothetical protein
VQVALLAVVGYCMIDWQKRVADLRKRGRCRLLHDRL